MAEHPEIDLLFVYGSLLSPDNEFALLLANSSGYFGKGRARGELFDIGEYPGAIFSNLNDGYVHGTVFRLKAPRQILKELDKYEGFGPDEEQPNEFIRELTWIELNDGAVQCWAYNYNAATNGCKLIPGGDYQEYLQVQK